ncbi:hypothetical protein PSCICM_44590 [Pseudomonas cichorii]|nr:hypothetical protein PSCICM_44590 [Pseudomonas cichorii]
MAICKETYRYVMASSTGIYVSEAPHVAFRICVPLRCYFESQPCFKRKAGGYDIRPRNVCIPCFRDAAVEIVIPG